MNATLVHSKLKHDLLTAATGTNDFKNDLRCDCSLYDEQVQPTSSLGMAGTCCDRMKAALTCSKSTGSINPCSSADLHTDKHSMGLPWLAPIAGTGARCGLRELQLFAARHVQGLATLMHAYAYKFSFPTRSQLSGAAPLSCRPAAMSQIRIAVVGG